MEHHCSIDRESETCYTDILKHVILIYINILYDILYLYYKLEAAFTHDACTHDACTHDACMQDAYSMIAVGLY